MGKYVKKPETVEAVQVKEIVEQMLGIGPKYTFDKSTRRALECLRWDMDAIRKADESEDGISTLKALTVEVFWPERREPIIEEVDMESYLIIDPFGEHRFMSEYEFEDIYKKEE